MKKIFKPIAALLVAVIFLLGCDDNNDNSPLPTIEGNYVGSLAKPFQGIQENEHQIKLTVLDAETVKIEPISGGSVSLELKLIEISMGNYNLEHESDQNFVGGTISTTVNRLAYSYFLGGQDDSNIEVFTGVKQ